MASNLPVTHRSGFGGLSTGFRREGATLLSGRYSQAALLMWRTDGLEHRCIFIPRSELSLFPTDRHFQSVGWIFQEPQHENEIVEAINVDNSAGVSVLVSLMTAVVRNNWKVNLDCLFTPCEEAGFCGVVAEILEG